MPPPRRQNSAVDALVEALRHDIRSGKLRPGQRIDLDEWGEGMGASRTPVRLALERLEAEGFVKLSGRRGATIIDVTLNHIEDVLCTRLVLDATLGRVGARNITQQDLDVLESLLEQIEAIKLPEEHAKMVDPAQRFHAQLFHAAGAPMMHRLAMQSVHHTDVFLSSMWFTNRRIADVGKAYFAQLYAACLAREWSSKIAYGPKTFESFRGRSHPLSSCSCGRLSTRGTTRSGPPATRPLPPAANAGRRMSPNPPTRSKTAEVQALKFRPAAALVRSSRPHDRCPLTVFAVSLPASMDAAPL